MTDVHVEVVWLRRHDDGGLAYRTATVPLPPDEPPDRVALSLADPLGDAVAVLHSTSWRHEADSGIVLTYAAVPRTGAADGGEVPVALVEAGIVSSTDARRPQPPDIHAHHVAAHAVHHLAALAARPGCHSGGHGRSERDLGAHRRHGCRHGNR